MATRTFSYPEITAMGSFFFEHIAGGRTARARELIGAEYPPPGAMYPRSAVIDWDGDGPRGTRRSGSSEIFEEC